MALGETSQYDVPEPAASDVGFWKQLTPRQLEYLQCRRDGMSWREVAESMGITARTVYDYARECHFKWMQYQGFERTSKEGE